MYSQRFNKIIHLTEHAKKRMIERDISMELLSDLIETGDVSYKDDKHAWIAKFSEDDILELYFSENPIVRETTQEMWFCLTMLVITLCRWWY